MDRIALVTGGTSGIGLITARDLALAGMQVVITARDPARAASAVERVRVASGKTVEVLSCDFASMASIRAAAAEFQKRHGALHVLVNNAGAINGTRQLSKDGLELSFAVNHLGYFLLSNLLLPLLTKSAPSRVVSVASEASRMGHIDFDDLQAQRRYGPFRQYGTTKLMNIAFALELADRLRGTGVTSNALHPGAIASGFGVMQGWLGLGFKLARPFLITPEKGARTQVWLASSPDAEGLTGGYFVGKRQRLPPRQARDPEVRKRLWDVSAKLTSLAAAP